MSETPKPLSAALSQGWEVQSYSSTLDTDTGAIMHCFLLRKQGRAKILAVRKKVMGEGVIAEEMEV